MWGKIKDESITPPSFNISNWVYFTFIYIKKMGQNDYPTKYKNLIKLLNIKKKCN